MQCEAGPEAHRETGSIKGQDGTIYALSVKSGDDHGKNTHLCETEYELTVTPAHGEPEPTTLSGSADDEWGRKIVLSLEGWSADGTRLLGLSCEASNFHHRPAGVWTVWIVNPVSGTSETRELPRAAGNCDAAVSVAGTLPDGTPVIATPDVRSSWILTTPDEQGSSPTGSKAVIEVNDKSVVRPLRH
jgi:hypothetical protein